MRVPPAPGGNNTADTIKGQVVGIEKWLRHAKGRDLCVQAGGNVGYFPIELAKHFKFVHTFEPEHENFECLRYNCQLPNVTLYHAALGEKGSMSGMHIDKQNMGAHYLEGDGDIKVKTIDDLALTACDLIALDVEGYEWQALKGALGTINNFQPVIVIEQKGHGRRYGYEDKDMEQWLVALGYRDVEKVFRDHVWVYG